MFPKPIPDAWRVALLGYSFWFPVAGLLVLLVPELVYAKTGIDMNPVLRLSLVVGFVVAGLAGRLLQQPAGAWRSWLRIAAICALVVLASFTVATVARGETARATPLVSGTTVTEAAIMAEAVPLIQRWEGVVLTAYRDIVGVWTICSGTTRGVIPGMRKTAEECADLLRAEALEYWRGVTRYMTEDTLRHRITPKRGAAWASFAVNVGISAAGRSTATRRLNAGHISGACYALTWWNKAGGRVILGLVNRRGEEEAYCLVGVA